jgi:hypothetical protein
MLAHLHFFFLCILHLNFTTSSLSPSFVADDACPLLASVSDDNGTVTHRRHNSRRIRDDDHPKEIHFTFYTDS